VDGGIPLLSILDAIRSTATEAGCWTAGVHD